jgi:eukaryotic-like serine/threonine-protein kinase
VPSPGVLRATAWTLPAAGGSRQWINTPTASSRNSRGVATGRRRSGANPPRVFGGRWEVVKRLGQGGQGTAFMVRDLTTDGQAEWVLKQLRFDRRESRARREKRRARFAREIAALKRLQSSHIPPVLDSNEEEAYFVTPYVGKSFDRLPHVVDDPQALLERFRGTVVAVHDAHSRGVVHRDIKPNNATVHEGTSFLVDYGICADDES